MKGRGPKNSGDPSGPHPGPRPYPEGPAFNQLRNVERKFYQHAIPYKL